MTESNRLGLMISIVATAEHLVEKIAAFGEERTRRRLSARRGNRAR
jgi:hypothetical protein